MPNKVLKSSVSALALWASALLLCLSCGATSALAQKMPDVAMPASVPSASSTLIYKATGSPLTVGELAALQRKKLEQDFYKKAGFSTEKPAPVPSKSLAAVKALPKSPPTRAHHQLVVMGVYGPAGAERAEVRYDGTTHVLAGRARIGLITVEALAPGVVHIVAEHAGRASRFALRPGQTVEVSE